MKAYCCVLEDWSQFYKLANLLRAKSWAYRGQGKSKWGLKTSLERECEDAKTTTLARESVETRTAPIDNTGGTVYADELSAIKLFAQYARKQFPYAQDDYINWLAVMQHFGAKTRLLDFSRSLFVALYFAFEWRYSNERRAIWCVNLEPIECFVKQKFARITKRKMCDKSECYRMIANTISETAADYVANPAVLPIWLQGNNERMDAQSGMFLLPVTRQSFVTNLAASLGLETTRVDHPTKISFDRLVDEVSHDNVCLIKLKFKHSMQNEAWQVLDQANVTARALFPGLEGIARGIRVNIG